MKQNVRVLALLGSTQLFGHERANVQVLKCLAEMGFGVRVVINSDADAEVRNELERVGLDFVRAPFGYSWGKYLLGWRFIYAFRNLYGLISTNRVVAREVKGWQPTHIYGGAFIHLHYGLYAIARSGLPVIFRAGDDYPWTPVMRRLIGEPALKRVENLVCNCRFLYDRFASLPNAPKNIRVIYNYPPSRPENVAGAGPIPEVLPGALLVVFVGQVSEKKGIGMLLDAVAHMTREGRRVALWIAGRMWGSAEDHWKRRVHELGLGAQVTFLGYRTDIDRLLARADVHACPSITDDPSPNVVLEAKRAGVPSVAFQVGGVGELIRHEENGYLCEERTVEALVAGIEYLGDRPETRQKAGEAAKRSLEGQFGEERFRREWREVFLA